MNDDEVNNGESAPTLVPLFSLLLFFCRWSLTSFYVVVGGHYAYIKKCSNVSLNKALL